MFAICLASDIELGAVYLFMASRFIVESLAPPHSRKLGTIYTAQGLQCFEIYERKTTLS